MIFHIVTFEIGFVIGAEIAKVTSELFVLVVMKIVDVILEFVETVEDCLANAAQSSRLLASMD